MSVNLHSLSQHRWTRFLIYGFLGLTLEVVYTGLSSLLKGDLSMHGFTFLVMIPIYGLALFLEPVHNFVRSQPWWLRGVVYLLLIWGIEYISGWFLNLVLGYCPWYYDDPLNINHWITLRMAPEWFLAGLGFEIIHDHLVV